MDTDRARGLLEQERERLQAIRNGLGAEHLDEGPETESIGELSTYDQHPADVASEVFEQTKDLAILEQLEANLAEIERAFERLEQGTYGTCEACGKPIVDDRLEAQPATRFCVDDQAALEREVRATPPNE